MTLTELCELRQSVAMGVAERLDKFGDALDTAPRLGAATDKPEGERYVQISDTWLRCLADSLRANAELMR